MSWKFVCRTNATDLVAASSVARKAGYLFFLYKGEVYFKDAISTQIYETGIKEKDLF